MMEREKESWQEVLSGCKENGSFSANRFLTLTAELPDEEFTYALEFLDARQILLDVTDLKAATGSRQLGTRLKLEEKLSAKKITLRDLDVNDPLRLFLQEMGKMPSKTDYTWTEELLRLNDAQREMIAESYLPKVVAAAKKLTGKGVLMMDLIQEGSLALWQALAFWMGEDMDSYLDRSVRMAMHRVIVSQARADGIGVQLKNQMSEYKKADSRLLSSLGRNPTREEIARELSADTEIVETLEKMLKDAASERTNTADIEADPEEELEVDGTAYYQSRQRVNDLLGELTETERRLLAMRFGLDTGKPMDIEETAEILGISQAEALRMEERALAKMRKSEEKE